ncbi:MAG: efflux RND transporter permease subunit, partial [Planctomycetota bacterium]
IVVDDAIVVVENTARLIEEEGLNAKDAARKSMKEITGPVIATTLVLLAVFIPTAVLPGITGQLYRQFGVTLSIATVLSSINALTLSPALCGILLRKQTRRPLVLFRWFNAVLGVGTAAYTWTVRRSLRLSLLTVVAFLGMVAGVFGLLRATPTGFIPLEDQKYFFVNVQLPPASKEARTDEVMRQAEQQILDTPGVAGVVSIGGFSLLTGAAEPNSGTCVIILDQWEDRTTPETSIESIIGSLSAKLSEMPEAIIFPFRPPSIQGLGNSGGFEIQIQDRAAVGLDLLEDVTNDIIDSSVDSGQITNPFTAFSVRTPKLFVDIDRVKAQRLGVPLETVFATLSGNLGSAYVNDFNAFGRVYQVRMQSEPQFRQNPSDILLLELRDAQGDTLPMSSIAKVNEVIGPSTVYRYNLYASASISGEAAAGVSTGQALAQMERLAEAELPEGLGYEWTGTALQQKRAGNAAPIAFALSIIFVYLFLAAQYESWVLPITIMATIPIGILGALAATLLRDLDNNVYTQIGLVLMVALVCKNAILIVEFAEQLRRGGKPVAQATVEAATLRFRPILMTALSFVLGTAPLLIATGAGANGRQSIGTAVFGGMALATLIGVLFIPVLYGLIRRIVRGKTSPA